jgi:hypothetical protein
MKALIGVVAALVLATSVLVLLNWQAISAPTSLSVGFTTLEAPLGLTLLACAGLLVATLLALIAYQRAAALVEARQFARELRAQRELADEAEASRFTELRSYVEADLRNFRQEVAARDAETTARLDRLEHAMLARVSELANGISAHLGELEDKLDRSLAWGSARDPAGARSP